MSAEAPAFVDTNVLLYVHDDDEPAKRAAAKAALTRAASLGGIRLSAQVLQELYVTTTQKLARPLSAHDAELAVRYLSALPIVSIDPEIVLAGIAGSQRYGLSLWDALILEAALRSGCDRVLSEDLQHGFVYKETVVVEDPFAES